MGLCMGAGSRLACCCGNGMRNRAACGKRKCDKKHLLVLHVFFRFACEAAGAHTARAGGNLSMTGAMAGCFGNGSCFVLQNARYNFCQEAAAFLQSAFMVKASCAMVPADSQMMRGARRSV